MRSMVMPAIGAAMVLLTSIVVQGHQALGVASQPAVAPLDAAPAPDAVDGPAAMKLPPPYAMRLAVW
jgi:hypothetical protein